MLRTILGVILGLFVGVLVVGVVEGVGHELFPPPPGVNLTDPARLKAAMALVPVQAKVFVVLAWFLGTLAGAMAANLIAGRRAWAGRAAAAILVAFAVWTMVTLPHPAWFWAASLLAMLAAAAVADLAFGRPRKA